MGKQLEKAAGEYWLTQLQLDNVVIRCVYVFVCKITTVNCTHWINQRSQLHTLRW